MTQFCGDCCAVHEEGPGLSGCVAYLRDRLATRILEASRLHEGVVKGLLLVNNCDPANAKPALDAVRNVLQRALRG